MSKRSPYQFSSPDPAGPQYFRSLEERLPESDEARSLREAEFAPGHTDTPPSEEATFLGRRGFLGALSGSLALVGAEGCRRPLEHVLPYAKMPEEVIPGVPSHYTTLAVSRGEVLGIVAECHEGRPTKLEGNPDHPASLGALDLVTQASILDLYDPDRSSKPLEKGQVRAWADADRVLGDALRKHEADKGAKLRVLFSQAVSPTQERLRRLLLNRFPKASVHVWSSVSDANVLEGTKLAFGEAARPLGAFDKARVIASLDADFLGAESGSVRAAKLFARGRKLETENDTMSRLYVVEPIVSVTGMSADHRLRLSPTRIESFALALGRELVQQGLNMGDLGAQLRSIPVDPAMARFVTTLAKDLMGARGRSLVVSGASQPPRVHALVCAMNQALGNVGSTVDYVPVGDKDAPTDTVGDMKGLVAAMAGGQVDTLIMLGGNPVYDAPADLAFGDALSKVSLSVHLSTHADETGEKATWHLPRAHAYEAWDDGRSMDGSITVQQPLVSPLFEGRSDVELLSFLADAPQKTGHEAVRVTVMELLARARGAASCVTAPDGTVSCVDTAGNPVAVRMRDLEKDWKQVLREGVVRMSARPSVPALRYSEIGQALAKRAPSPVPSKDAVELAFRPDAKLVDGSHANNAWLLEMPDPVTKIVWDNAAVVSPATAKAIGVENGDRLKIAVNGKSIEIPAWIVPGVADFTVALSLGWGRKKAGRLGTGKGFDVYPLRTSQAFDFAVGAKVERAGGDAYVFGQTQVHNSMEGRPIAREATYAEFKSSPNFAALQAPPPRGPKTLPLWQSQDYSQGPQWGMVIDLNACTGCNACVIACQAENNVPVVGKIEVARGREMHWLRLDRYYVENAHGASADDPMFAHQPMMCVHCEDAPCENVCPVNATVHSPEGLNEMAYNRCIGTRYCANNCPYKVRRFNYLNWHNDAVWKAEGDIPETHKMQQNPNVSVRFRGVMEKCSYCVQRIQSAKIAAKRENRSVVDGEIVTACQQTCPSEAITFGDLLNAKSRVAKAASNPRAYKLLAELGTRPRTMYLGKVRNLNPEAVAPAAGPGNAGSIHKEHG